MNTGSSVALETSPPMARGDRALWAPAKSPLSIGFPIALLLDLRRVANRRNSRGILYGNREADRVDVLTAQPHASLNAVGMFAIRPRGEVFLTEADLEYLDASGVPMALVVSGKRAGCFVWEVARLSVNHEHSRCIQSIRSYLEFSLEEPAPLRQPCRITGIIRRSVLALIS